MTGSGNALQCACKHTFACPLTILPAAAAQGVFATIRELLDGVHEELSLHVFYAQARLLPTLRCVFSDCRPSLP